MKLLSCLSQLRQRTLRTRLPLTSSGGLVSTAKSVVQRTSSGERDNSWSAALLLCTRNQLRATAARGTILFAFRGEPILNQ